MEHAAILMGTRNGARFLEEQLASIARQSHTNWSLHVSDDGSRDGTLEILAKFALAHDLSIAQRSGPNLGFARNFLTLAEDPAIQADFYAFCDQDDVWHPDKLARGIACLRKVPQTTPSVYATRAELIDRDGGHLGQTLLFRKPASFKNALVQNIASGNTMLFNASAKRLLEYGSNQPIASHDWWVYLLVTAVGGIAFYDPQPSIRYRQHRSNAVGGRNGLPARAFRVSQILRGHRGRYNAVNLRALRAFDRKLTDEAVETIGWFEKSRQAVRVGERLAYFRKSGVYAQTRSGQAGLMLAVLLGRL